VLNPKISLILKGRFPSDVVDSLLSTYSEVVSNYRIEKWKPSELDAGHFVEAARRIIESELFKIYTPLSKSMGSFSPAVLSKYESASGDEAFRILIPRVLFSVYCIRNKRGVGHISLISPNKLDATYILNSTKWVLAELVRLASTSNANEAHEITNYILEREVDLIWDDGESFMILNTKLKTDQKVLVSLYKKDRIALEELRNLIGYQNKSNFKKIALKLKSNMLIDITQDSICKLSPLGVKEAELIIENT
jgi:hypothetical protein